jgi:hypothetical protein
MNAKNFQDTVKSLFHEQFPNGYCHISKLALGGGIHIKCGLIGNIEDVTSQIRENDPMSISIFIHENITFNDESTDLENLVIEFSQSNISVLPDNPYMFCKSQKIPARKIKAIAEKSLVRLGTYFKRAKEVVTSESENSNIIHQDKIDKKYL